MNSEENASAGPVGNGPTRAMWLAAAVVVASCLVVFVVLAEDVHDGGGLIAHDRQILDWFIAHRTAWHVDVANAVSAVAAFAVLFVAAAVIGLVLRLRGIHPLLAFAPVLSLVVGGLASTGAKAFFERERPPLVLHETTVTLSAFPSGHATDAAAFFVALSLVLAITCARTPATRALLIAIGLGLAVVVGLSRLILGVHWPSDVVAGWALGTAVAVTVVVSLWSACSSGSPATTRD